MRLRTWSAQIGMAFGIDFQPKRDGGLLGEGNQQVNAERPIATEERSRSGVTCSFHSRRRRRRSPGALGRCTATALFDPLGEGERLILEPDFRHAAACPGVKD